MIQTWSNVLTACENLVFRRQKDIFLAAKMYKIDLNHLLIINNFKNKLKCAKMLMEVSLKENMRCQTFIHLLKKIKIRLSSRACKEIQVIISKIMVMNNKISELNCKKQIKIIINMNIKMKINKDKILIMEMQINSNIITQEIMETIQKINIKEIIFKIKLIK